MKIVPITLKVNLLILVSLTVGIGAITVYLGIALTQTIEDETRASLDQESQIVYEAIEQLMMPGEAPLVVNYFQGIGDLDPRLRIYLYRTDGTAAFSDNSTIAEVNDRIDSRMFLPRGQDQTATMAPEIEITDAFDTATSIPARTVVYQERQGDATVVRYIKPLINLPKCTVCHGSDHTVRGVIDIHSDISASIAQQRTAVYSASGAFLLLVAAVGFVMSRYLQRRFILPLREIGATCEAVTMGDFERRSRITNNDELGVLSRTVNTMVEGLYERFVLSRFVSGTTLQALGGGTASRTENLTFLFTDIRGFTSFTETHSPEEVVGTLNALLSDQSRTIDRHGGDIDKYVGDEIVAVFSGEDGVRRAVAAALDIRRSVDRDADGRYGGLRVGIGINRGAVIVCEIGSADRADFTAIGDNVNVAARLCSGARPGEILVSDAVRNELATGGGADSDSDAATDADRPQLEGPYRMQVKGKAEALRVFRLLDGNADGERDAP